MKRISAKNKEQDLLAIRALQDGEEVQFTWSEDGGAIVRRDGESLTLYDFPIYPGSDERRYFFLCGSLSDADALIGAAHYWCG